MCFKRSREDWEGVLHSNLWKLEDVKKDLFAPLLLSFYDLPLPLKCCFYIVLSFRKIIYFLEITWSSYGWRKDISSQWKI